MYCVCVACVYVETVKGCVLCARTITHKFPMSISTIFKFFKGKTPGNTIHTIITSIVES